MKYTENQIKKIEKQIENRKELFCDEVDKLLVYLYNFRDNVCTNFVKRPSTNPLIHSWKPSKKATKVFTILNDTIVKISEIIED